MRVTLLGHASILVEMAGATFLMDLGSDLVSRQRAAGYGSAGDAIASASDGDTINFSVTGTIVLTTGELLMRPTR